MVSGFTKFKEKFQGFENQYVVNGGTACNLLMENEDKSFRATKDVDIVLMGNESETDFLLQYDYPNILKIPGFYYTRFNKKNIANFTIPNRKQIKRDEYRNYLDNLGLKMPSSFKSTHSLTNEWCFYKWNSFMGFKEDVSALEHHLYFDYLITLERLNRVTNKTVSEHLKERIKNLPNGLRLLVIDDNSGWHEFFEKMFSDRSVVDVHCLGTDFKKIKYEDVESQIRQEVKSFQPDIIILDFRLMEDKDAEIKDNMKHISGYQVLSKVLKGDYKTPCDSFGRQVLIFTATSRIENILLLKEGNADGFILKEKPENYNGKEITKDLISKMISTFEMAVDRAKFLIPLNEKLDNLIKLVEATNNTKTEIGIAIKLTSQLVRQLTQNNNLNKDILKIEFLNVFSILESIKSNKEKLFIFIDSEASRIKLAPEIYVLWEDICEIRNCLAHGKDKISKGKLKGQVIDSVILFEWNLNLLTFVLEFMKLYLK